MFKAVMKLFRSLTTLLLGLTTAASVALAAPTGLGAGSAGTGSPFAGGGQPKTVTVQLVSRQTAGIPRGPTVKAIFNSTNRAGPRTGN